MHVPLGHWAILAADAAIVRRVPVCHVLDVDGDEAEVPVEEGDPQRPRVLHHQHRGPQRKGDMGRGECAHQEQECRNEHDPNLQRRGDVDNRGEMQTTMRMAGERIQQVSGVKKLTDKKQGSWTPAKPPRNKGLGCKHGVS